VKSKQINDKKSMCKVLDNRKKNESFDSPVDAPPSGDPSDLPAVALGKEAMHCHSPSAAPQT
jgi:hypothetical protein